MVKVFDYIVKEGSLTQIIYNKTPLTWKVFYE